jgi:hypothetical protein
MLGKVADYLSAKLEVEAQTAAMIFAEETSGFVGASWLESVGEIARCVCEKARFADLVILGQYDEWQGFPESHPLPVSHSIVLRCGRPVLVVPAEVRLGPLAKIMVAWDGSREVVRAVHDALPLLHMAKSVRIVRIAKSVEPDNVDRAGYNRT